MRILKQPLLHFLLLGACLFVLFDLTAVSKQSPDNVIVVDRQQLLTHLQFRSRAFDGERFDAVLDGMSEAQREVLIDEYVREESLHREALALGLDANDYILRQRLIQKVEYLARGFEEPPALSPETYFAQHRDDYFVAPAITFTHVFINPENYADLESADTAARGLLETLQAKPVTFAEATGYGDRFVFHRNYVDRTGTYIASHFGGTFAAAVFQLPVGQWQGPVVSGYGLHLVLVNSLESGYYPALQDVLTEVTYDARQEAVKQQTERAVQAVRDRYSVRVEL